MNLFEEEVMKRFIVLLLLCFLIVGCSMIDDPNVIGIQIIEDGTISEELKILYFPLRSDAEKYYDKNNIGKYYLFISTDNKAEEWFKNFNGLLDTDGSKTVSFLSDNNLTAPEKVIAFIDNAKLAKIKQVDKETQITEQEEKNNFVIHDTYSKEESTYITMLNLYKDTMNNDFYKFAYSIEKRDSNSYDNYRKDIEDSFDFQQHKLNPPSKKRENIDYSEIDKMVDEFTYETMLIVNDLYKQKNNLSKDDISNYKQKYNKIQDKLNQVIDNLNRITSEPAKKEIVAQSKLQASEAAKAAADSDNTGAPYFVAYDYNATDYLVSAYQNQNGPGNYSVGSALYFVNKATGKVQADVQIDFSKVNFSKCLAVYSKLSGKIIE
jgi:hypothetical protein